MTLLSIGAMYIYKNKGHIAKTRGGIVNKIAEASLGNLGGASAQCVNTFFGLGSKMQEIKCPKGHIKGLAYFGAVAAYTDKVQQLADGGKIPYK